MTYIASPKYSVGTPQRREDCEQCISSALGALPQGHGTETDSAIIESGLEAGWNEDEIREVLRRIRPATSTPDTGISPT